MKLSEVKDNSACIYKLTFPDGMIYVGQAKDLSGKRQKNSDFLSYLRINDYLCTVFFHK